MKTRNLIPVHCARISFVLNFMLFLFLFIWIYPIQGRQSDQEDPAGKLVMESISRIRAALREPAAGIFDVGGRRKFDELDVEKKTIATQLGFKTGDSLWVAFHNGKEVLVEKELGTGGPLAELLKYDAIAVRPGDGSSPKLILIPVVKALFGNLNEEVQRLALEKGYRQGEEVRFKVDPRESQVIVLASPNLAEMREPAKTLPATRPPTVKTTKTSDTKGLLTMKVRFKGLRPKAQQQALEAGYQENDDVPCTFNPATGEFRVLPRFSEETPSSDDLENITGLSQTAPASPIEPISDKNLPDFQSRFNDDFAQLKKTGAGTRSKIRLEGKSVEVWLGEVVQFGLYKGFVQFDKLSENIKEKARKRGYRPGDVLGLKISDGKGTLLANNVLLSAEQQKSLIGMGVEMAVPWHQQEKVARIKAITPEFNENWNKEYLITFVSMESQAEKTFPGYVLLGSKLRPELKGLPFPGGELNGKVVEIWYAWHNGENVGIVTDSRFEDGNCIFTLESLDGQERQSLRTAELNDIRVVATCRENYVKGQSAQEE